jgi:hypothetical protein
MTRGGTISCRVIRALRSGHLVAWLLHSNGHILGLGYLYPFTPSFICCWPPRLQHLLELHFHSPNSLSKPLLAKGLSERVNWGVRLSPLWEFIPSSSQEALGVAKIGWFVFATLEACFEMLGITCCVPSSCGAPVIICISLLLCGVFLVSTNLPLWDWVRQEALCDSPPFVGSSTEM